MRYRHWILAVIIVGTLLGGVSKAVQDTIAHHYVGSVFEHLDPDYWGPSSWKAKYADFDAGDRRPAFPGSLTIFVSLTDAWHLFGLLELLGLCAAGVAAGRLAEQGWRPAWATVFWVLFLFVGNRVVFHLCYHYIFSDQPVPVL
jgi:hypothetical protein